MQNSEIDAVRRKNLTPSLFMLEHMGPFSGFHNPRARWNGWATPYFTREQLEPIIDALGDGWAFNLDAGELYWEQDTPPEDRVADGDANQLIKLECGLYCFDSWVAVECEG